MGVDLQAEETLQEAYFNDAVQAYIFEQKTVVAEFLGWIIRLGSILYKHREELKKQWKWLEYCSAIWIHITAANQQIRMYELSLSTSKLELLKSAITNWTKLNLFLSLKEWEKDELLEKVEGWEITSETTADEFREIASSVKEETVDVIAHTEEFDNSHASAIVEGDVDDVFIATTAMAEGMRSMAWLSKETVTHLKAYVLFRKSFEVLAKAYPLTPSADREAVKELFDEQMNQMRILIDNNI